VKIDQIKKVCIVGGGLMGRQIALNTAIHGFDTDLTDSASGVLENVRVWAKEYMDGRVEKGRLTREAADVALARFRVAESLEHAAGGASLVIEAIIEDKAVKTEFFKNLNAIVEKDAVIATNSSYMNSSLFADCVDNPARLANLHYFNPALVLKLTEVVQGAHTSDETAETLMEFSRRTGKTPILVRKECEGFVVNRILRALKDEAFRIVEEGICSPQEVDLGLELGLSHPMGPFRLNDLTGIDLTYHANERRLAKTGVKPPGYGIIKARFDAGEYGRKSGKGFYDYRKKWRVIP
jgi:3-hydroxybutyryl-CoA dehydrogenase